jgi:hypothetical protein
MKKRDLFSIFAIILAFSGLSACTGFPESRARTASGPLFTGSGGRGLVIAVPAPSMPGGGQANSWMPQLFQEALNANQGMKEASQRIQSFGQGSPGAGIRERAEWAVTQKTRWEKIFNDLRAYAEKELWIVVYDFSTISDEFDAGRNTVTITFNPGIKIIPNRTVLTVWKNVTEEYLRLKAIDENKPWISAVQPVNILGDRFPMLVNAGLYDEYNDLIGSTTWIQSSSPRPRFQTFFEEFPQGITRMQVIAQHKYFTDYAFGPVSFRVPVKKITDDIKVQIEKVHNDGFGRRYNAKIMSLAEWNEWLKNQ